jgi:hypothetical protein
VNVLVDLSIAGRAMGGAWRGLPGRRPNCRIQTRRCNNRPFRSAVSARENWNVYVAKDGRAQIREIKILRRSGRLAAVATGLTAGELAIVYPSDRIASGVGVELRQAENAGGLAGSTEPIQDSGIRR